MTGRPIDVSFALAVADIGTVARSHTADTGSYEYRYAGLPEVLAEVKRACAGQGLVMVQSLGQDSHPHGDYLTVTTYVYDTDTGDRLEFGPAACKVGADPQKMGGAATYLRRYALVSLFSIPTPDDDATEATKGIHDEAAEAKRRQTEARRVFSALGKMGDDAKARVSALREQHGRPLTLAELEDDAWRALVESEMAGEAGGDQ